MGKFLATTAVCLTLGLLLSAAAPSAAASFDRGVAAYEAADYQRAVQAFTQSLELAPGASTYSNRCLAYLQLDAYAQAVGDCTQALRLDPEQSEAHLNRGLAYYHLAQLSAALIDFDQALAQQSDYRAAYNRGLVQAAQADYVGAIATYTQTLAEFPDLPIAAEAEIYRERGAARLATGATAAAVADLSCSLAQEKAAYTYFLRAWAYQKLQQFSASLRDYNQALALDPTDPAARLRRGLLHQQLGHLPLAVFDLQRAAAGFQRQHQDSAYQQVLQRLHRIESLRTALG